MNYDQDTSKETFISTWPDGYKEDFQFYAPDAEMQVSKVIQRYINPSAKCLEIGSGGGYLTTRWLLPNFHDVTCIDVIPRPPFLDNPRVNYIEAADRDFKCTGVADASIDFAFSFGVFCHLTCEAQSEYLRSIYRVLRSGGNALIAFANWPRHNGPDAIKDVCYANKRHADGTCWFYNDIELTKAMVADAGFVDFDDTIPDFRDTLAAFRKP